MSYTSTTLIFSDDKITISESGAEVMMDWEAPIMSASAAYITQGGGDILEIGFGMGIASNYIQSHSISSHTIIENHPQIISKSREWASGKSNVTIVSQSWYDVRNSLGTYDGVFYDTYGDDNAKQFSSSLSNWTKNGTKVTWWQVRSNNKSNYHNIQNVTYKSINVSPPSNTYFTGSTIYYLQMKEI